MKDYKIKITYLDDNKEKFSTLLELIEKFKTKGEDQRWIDNFETNLRQRGITYTNFAKYETIIN